MCFRSSYSLTASIYLFPVAPLTRLNVKHVNGSGEIITSLLPLGRLAAQRVSVS